MSNQQTIIYLIRHGDVHNPANILYGRKFDVRLSDLGKRQIKRTAEKISEREEKPIVIFSSPLRRTMESSDIISNHFQSIPIKTDERLLETGASKIEGKPIAWYEDYKDPYGDPDLDLERQEIISARMFEALKRTHDEYRGYVTCLVSHGDPLAFLMWRLVNPNVEIPSMNEIGKHFYLKRSESWRLVLNDDASVSDREYLRQELIV